MTFYVLQSETVVLDCFRLGAGGEGRGRWVKNLTVVTISVQINILIVPGVIFWLGS